MKNIRTVSQKEMRKMFPDLMEALDNPQNAKYCWGKCDGTRIFKNNKCTICGWSNK